MKERRCTWLITSSRLVCQIRPNINVYIWFSMVDELFKKKKSPFNCTWCESNPQKIYLNKWERGQLSGLPVVSTDVYFLRVILWLRVTLSCFGTDILSDELKSILLYKYQSRTKLIQNGDLNISKDRDLSCTHMKDS